MLAVKGYYRNGHIELAEPIPEHISTAELNIVVIPVMESTPESDFKAIGLKSVFDAKEDADVDWEKFFGLK